MKTRAEIDVACPFGYCINLKGCQKCDCFVSFDRDTLEVDCDLSNVKCCRHCGVPLELSSYQFWCINCGEPLTLESINDAEVVARIQGTPFIANDSGYCILEGELIEVIGKAKQKGWFIVQFTNGEKVTMPKSALEFVKGVI